MGSRKEQSSQGFSNPSMYGREQGSTRTAFKSRLCKKFESGDGCQFGQKCHFAHGDQDLRKEDATTSVQSQSGMTYSGGAIEDKMTSRSHQEPSPPGLAVASSFGAVSTAKVSIDSSLAGFIIGKGGVNAKAISRATGAKIVIRDNESDLSLKNVVMEGSLDQIRQASAMVRELLANKEVYPAKPQVTRNHAFKTKVCDNFSKGACKYGDRCFFAHS